MTAAKRREGFERLLGAVALAEVGLILSREFSRLLRTDRDFCQPTRAPVGYVDNLATHRIEIDRDRAPLIAKLFEW